jgi:hypothetical protein
VARTRTTKKLAQRIDLNYFKRPTPLKRAKFLLSVLLPLLALIWISWRGLSGDHRVYSSGRMSKAHAVLEKECAACHLRTASAFFAKAADDACLSCHDGPIHHPSRVSTPNCAVCHTEHRGHINISAASNQACAECHINLEAASGKSLYANHIRSFEDGHPNFDAADKTNRDPGTIKLNHSLHMKPIRRAPSGPNVQLDCSDCHRTSAGATKSMWAYADAKYSAASASYTDADNFRPPGTSGPAPHNPSTGRELMAPVKFANACAACHLLTFDRRFDFGVPHDKPEVIRAFLARTFREYIAAHASEVRVQREAGRDLTGKPPPPEFRVLTPAQWVAERVDVAENLLWRKTCKQCHALTLSEKRSHGTIELPVPQGNDSDKLSGVSAELPNVTPANITLRWMQHAKFDHGAHEGFTCVSCHAKALTSTESSDILLPGIETCRKCHAPGPDHAESRCFECHTYHDWSKRREVTPKFTLPGLGTGGR